MATTITMPQLGETVTEGTVAQWLKSVGDSVEKYEAFVEISTDKVNAEVPSPVTGVIREIIVAAGETVPTGAPIAIIEEVVVAEAPAAPSPSAPVASNGAARNGNGAVAVSPAVARRMSPAVRRLARERGVDAATLLGTGGEGRVTALDVLAATTLPATNDTPPPQPPSVQPSVAAHARPSVSAEGERSSYSAPRPGTFVPLSAARKLIARRMTESLATAPHAWTMVEVDVTNVLAWRNREKERFQREQGYPLTLLPFFLRAVVRSLRAHPLLNARYADDGIVVEREVNVGIAIGLDASLLVPVIRSADTLTISGLAIAAGTLIVRARGGKITADDLSGGTFTVNNTGANGSILSKPIINGGQAAIVTMEAVVKRPIVINDAIAIRAMMNVCLSLDHRVIDGTGANGFLGDLKRGLEAMNPSDSL